MLPGNVVTPDAFGAGGRVCLAEADCCSPSLEHAETTVTKSGTIRPMLTGKRHIQSVAAGRRRAERRWPRPLGRSVPDCMPRRNQLHPFQALSRLPAAHMEAATAVPAISAGPRN